MSWWRRNFESVLIYTYIALAVVAFVFVMDMEGCAVVRSSVEPERVQAKDKALEYAHFWIQFLAGSTHPTWPAESASDAEPSISKVPNSPRDYCVAYAFSIWWHFFLNTLAVFGLIYSTYKWVESRRRTMEMAGLLYRRDAELKAEVLQKLLPDDISYAEASRQAKLVDDAFAVADQRLLETLTAEVGAEEAGKLMERMKRFLHQNI